MVNKSNSLISYPIVLGVLIVETRKKRRNDRNRAMFYLLSLITKKDYSRRGAQVTFILTMKYETNLSVPL